MTVEAITYISDFNTALPGANDPLQIEGASHIKGIKSGVKNTFPNLTGPVTATQTELNLLAGKTGIVTPSTAGTLTLLSDTTISGTPAAVDFLHGVSGMVIDSTYDEFIIRYSYLYSSAGSAQLRMQLANNGGGTFTNTSSVNAQEQTPSGWTALSSATHFRLTPSFTPTPATYAASGQVTLSRIVGASTSQVFISSVSTNTLGGGVAQAVGLDALSGTTAQFTGIRLLFDTGNFANNGRIKLYGRKA